MTRVNRAAEEVMGSAASWLGQPIADRAAGRALASAVRDAIQSGRASATADPAVLTQTVASGAPREDRVRTTPTRDEDDVVRGSVTLLEDITHLREIDRVKSEFIAIASHELRTPLTSASMAIRLLLEARTGPLTARRPISVNGCHRN